MVDDGTDGPDTGQAVKEGEALPMGADLPQEGEEAAEETRPEDAPKRGEEKGGGKAEATLLTDADDAPEGEGKEAAQKASDKALKPYRLDLAEQYAADKPDIEAYAAHCLELGMSREQAQASLDFSVKLHERRQAEFLEQRRTWQQEIKADAEFGGRNFTASCVAAKQALAAFDEEGEVRRMLQATGYGDNPAVVRCFARIGRAMAEDRLATGISMSQKAPLEERLYR